MKTNTPLPGVLNPQQTAHRRAGTELATASANWEQHLPAGWRNAVEIPLYFNQYSEYEISAERCIGYDADDAPCFTAHRFQLTSLATDDDEEFYEVVSYSEELAAWRLRDERWLVFRQTSSHNCGAGRSFYALSPDMPR